VPKPKNAAFEARITFLGERLVANVSDLVHAQCPRCERDGLAFDVEQGHVRISCMAPITYDKRRDTNECGYELVINRTPTSALPNPVFKRLVGEPKSVTTRTRKVSVRP